jgi:hypothetical protein
MINNQIIKNIIQTYNIEVEILISRMKNIIMVVESNTKTTILYAEDLANLMIPNHKT